MRRRDFIAILGSAAGVSSPVIVLAQAAAMPVVGVLGSASAAGFEPQLEGFRRGLAEAGFVEGRNVVIEHRWADDKSNRLPTLAAELVERRVAVILASGPPAALAAKAATASIPVTFVVGIDPVAAGLVTSLNHPGGNLTGMYLYIGGLVVKKLELLREMAPQVDTFGLLVVPGTPSAKVDTGEIESARRTNREPLATVMSAGSEAEVDAAFAVLGGKKTAGALIGTDTFYFSHRDHVVAAAALQHVPAIYYAREFVISGGLISYGANIPAIYRDAGIYTARMLKGERPAEMPVQQPTKFELVINLKTAKALGLNVPPSLLARADEVIE